MGNHPLETGDVLFIFTKKNNLLTNLVKTSIVSKPHYHRLSLASEESLLIVLPLR